MLALNVMPFAHYTVDCTVNCLTENIDGYQAICGNLHRVLNMSASVSVLLAMSSGQNGQLASLYAAPTICTTCAILSSFFTHNVILALCILQPICDAGKMPHGMARVQRQ